MSSGRVYLDYFRDMLDGVQKAVESVGEKDFQQFSEDEKTTYAVVRAIEIIGEAAKKIPKELRNTYHEIPLREIMGTRDKLIYEYFGVNLMAVWQTVQDDLPPLVEHLQAVINDCGHLTN